MTRLMVERQRTATEIPMNILFLAIEKNTVDKMTCAMGISKRSKIPILITIAAGISSSLTSGCMSLKPEI
jgi:hypothetical protein